MRAATGQLYRVTYTTSGLRRRVRTVNADDLQWLREAWYVGIRVTSSRYANYAEIARGLYQGGFNN